MLNLSPHSLVSVSYSLHKIEKTDGQTQDCGYKRNMKIFLQWKIWGFRGKNIQTSFQDEDGSSTIVSYHTTTRCQNSHDNDLNISEMMALAGRTLNPEQLHKNVHYVYVQVWWSIFYLMTMYQQQNQRRMRENNVSSRRRKTILQYTFRISKF
jgi:hypothetical protein